MSYSIIYDQQFVKLSNGKFIPMILSGDNNVYEVGTRNRVGKRSRDWSCWYVHHNSVGIYSADELISYVNGVRESEIKNREERKKIEPDTDLYDDKHFGWNTGLAVKGTCRTTTFGNYKGVFVTGMRKALTIEQLKELGVTLYIGTEWYHNDVLKNRGVEPFSFSINNEEDLQTAIQKAEECGYACRLTFRGMYDGKMKRIREKLFPRNKREKEAVAVKGYYVISITKKDTQNFVGYFFKSGRLGGFKFYGYKNYGKRFLTEKKADEMAALWNKRNTLYEFKKEWVEDSVLMYV